LLREHAGELCPIDTPGQRVADRFDHAGIVVPAAIEKPIDPALDPRPNPIKTHPDQQRQSRDDDQLHRQIAWQDVINHQQRARVQQQNTDRERGVHQRPIEHSIDLKQIVANHGIEVA